MIRPEPLFLACLLVFVPQAACSESQQSLPHFSCDTFHARISDTDLKARFGNANVTKGLVPWGGAEGEFNEGTILFADRPDSRVEIYWRNKDAKRDPAWIHIRGAASRWRSSGGVTLGMDLKTVEGLNGGAFRIAGFGTDLSGSVRSWSGGLLARQDIGGCRIGFRFVPPVADNRPEVQNLLRQLGSGGEFSSGDAAMQALNPRVGAASITHD